MSSAFVCLDQTFLNGWCRLEFVARHQLGPLETHAAHTTVNYCNVIEAPWLVNGGHGASLRHHKGIKNTHESQPRVNYLPSSSITLSRFSLAASAAPPPSQRYVY